MPNAGINKKVTFDMFENDIGVTLQNIAKKLSLLGRLQV